MRITTLKDGSTVEDPNLDRIYEENWDNLNYLVRQMKVVRRRNGTLKKPRSYTHLLLLWLDQLAEGACVGAGIGHELAARPQAVTGMTMDWARMNLYWPAQMEDGWPGGAYPSAEPHYEGTSVDAGMKVARTLGFYKNYYWALDLQELVLGLGYKGPAVLGLNWHPGMYETDANGFISPTGPVVGGHCICAIGVKIVWKSWINNFVSRTFDNVDLDRSYIILHNSWGQGWGVNGRAKITLADMQKLLDAQGEAAFPVRSDLKVIA